VSGTGLYRLQPVPVLICHCLLQVTQVCLVLACADFNPYLYSSLSQMLLGRFTDTCSPVTVLEVFLELMTHGQCHSVNNGTISTRDYDAKHWALTQSRVKGQFTTYSSTAGLLIVYSIHMEVLPYILPFTFSFGVDCIQR